MALARSLRHILVMRYTLIVLFASVVGLTLVAASDARADRQTVAPKNSADREEINRLVPTEDAETLRVKAKRQLYAEHCIMGRIKKVETLLDKAVLRAICGRRAARKYPLKAERKMPSQNRGKQIPLRPGNIDH
jgi:hypothetical protein